jgi:hypothetical protein
MTNRGWPSIGPAKHGLQRLRWKGATPLDLAEVRALEGGFRLRFTTPVDPASVQPASFAVRSWTYDHHEAYGCPERDLRELAVRAARLSEDRTSIDLTVDGLAPTRVHMVEAAGVRGPGGELPWHAVAWYTLNALP